MRKIRFEFRRVAKYSGNYIIYETNEIKRPTPAFHKTSYPVLKGKYTSGINGKNTAFATLIVSFPVPSGFEISKHFKGKNAGQRARAWLNRMLEDFPDYCHKDY
ncbi:MAG: hypothetical protein J7L32_07320 [Thermoplasmata archaeon]|nr:hypothetical protein [Thermoplasmata archaeon]